MDISLNGLAGFPITPILWMGAVWGGVALVRIILAVATYRDAQKLIDQGVDPEFCGPGAWALVTLITGIVGAAFYWVANRSSMRRAPSNVSLRDVFGETR